MNNRKQRSEVHVNKNKEIKTIDYQNDECGDKTGIAISVVGNMNKLSVKKIR